MINKDLENYVLITYVTYRGASDFSYVFCKNWSVPIIRIFSADLLKELHQVGERRSSTDGQRSRFCDLVQLSDTRDIDVNFERTIILVNS